jgi:hypothetical protein
MPADRTPAPRPTPAPIVTRAAWSRRTTVIMACVVTDVLITVGVLWWLIT